jgi:hypothetical protein
MSERTKDLLVGFALVLLGITILLAITARNVCIPTWGIGSEEACKWMYLQRQRCP